MATDSAVATGLLDCGEHVRGPSSSCCGRSGHGHRDPGPAPLGCVLERQLGGKKVRFTPADRALLAALLHRLRPQALGRMRLLVRPGTVLRWHRDLIRKRHAARSRPRRPGRPRTVRSIRALVLRLVRENPAWGYRRVHGELLMLGVKVAPSTVWEILKEAGIDPAPGRSATTWADFLRSQAEALVACDFFETVTLSGTRMFVSVTWNPSTEGSVGRRPSSPARIPM
jgi:putative transposase